MRSALTVFCDFDGTITTRDVVNQLLAALADSAWAAIETEWEQGRIGSRECLARQIPLIRGGWPAMERVLKMVTVAPTFTGFAEWCASHAIPLVIVSDGLDRVIEWVLAREHIRTDAVWANHLVIGESESLSVTFPYPPRDRNCRGGLCKCQVLADAKSRRVVIGDGLSDLCWASQADYCFAKGQLLASCRTQHIAHRAFKDFTDIQRLLAPLLAENSDSSTASLLTR